MRQARSGEPSRVPIRKRGDSGKAKHLRAGTSAGRAGIFEARRALGSLLGMSHLPLHGYGNGKGGAGGGNAPFSKVGGGSLSDHLPPQNLEAERSVLGGILLDNDVLHEVVGSSRPRTSTATRTR